MSPIGGSRDREELDLHDALASMVGTLDACLVICLPARRSPTIESEDPGRRATQSTLATTNRWRLDLTSPAVGNPPSRIRILTARFVAGRHDCSTARKDEHR